MTVSVVIPLWQHAQVLPRALASVLRQTRPPDQVLVVDDGSTDGGGDLARGPGVTVCRRPHRGACAARNHGVAQAAGDWVALLDADDEWEPAFLERTCAMAQEHPDLVAVFTNLRVGRRGRPLLRDVTTTKGVVDDYFETLLENGGHAISSSSVLVRRRALDAAGGFPEGVRVGEDLDTWARLAWTGRIGYVAECLVTCHLDARPRAASRTLRYPAFLRTFREWDASGRIPEQLRAHSLGFVDHVLSDHAVELAHAGRGAEARALLRDEWRLGGGAALYWKARLWSYLPPGLLCRLRSARAALRAAAAGRSH